MIYRRLKRAIDAVGATVLVVVLAPILVVIAVAVRLTLGSPVLFRQERPGLDGAPFELIKFRTMRIAPADATRDDDAARLTRFGKILRRFSLDEWPQLLNVVRGDLSFVGPRPLLTDYLELYSDEQARRHAVRPGMTGLAQVSGRNALDWPTRLRLDVAYVDTISFRRDLIILMKTVVQVVRGAGVSAPGEATVQRFRGER